MKKLNSIILAFLAITTIACDDEETVPDTQQPAVVISSPTEEAVFQAGETIPINADIKDDLALETVNLSVTYPDGETQSILSQSEGSFTEINETSIEELFSPSNDAAGNFTFTIEAKDRAGNTTNESVSVVVLEADRNAPAITIRNPEEGTSFQAGDAISLQTSVTDNSVLDEITVWVTPEGGQAHLVHTVESEDYISEGREADIEEVISLSSGTPVAGTYTITVKAADEHGNSAEKHTTIHILEVDTHAPAIRINSPAEGATFSSGVEISLQAEVLDNSALETVTVSITPPEGESRLVHTVDPEDFSNENSTANIDEMISLGEEPAVGSYIITVRATDIHENMAEESVQVLIREADTAAAEITIHAPAEGDEFTTQDAVHIRASVADQSRLDEVTAWVISPDGQTRLAHTENPADFLNEGREAEIEETISLSEETPAPGTYTIIFRATDEAGNMAEQSVSITVREADTTAPTITVYEPQSGSSFRRGEEVYLDVVVEDDQELAEIHIKVTLGGAFVIQDETITEFDEKNYHRVEGPTSIPNDAPTGTYYVTITATDTSGNQTVERLTFQVID